MNKEKIDLDAIAALSGLSVNEFERDSLYSDMLNMISFAESISSIVIDIHPKEISTTAACKMRRDIPKESLDRYTLLCEARSVSDGRYFSVPSAIKDREEKS